MSLRLVSSARNLREQFKGNGNGGGSNPNLLASSGSSVFTNASGVSQSRTLDPMAMTNSGAASVLSRQGTLLRSSSNGNLRRAKSVQKKNIISKVFTDESEQNESLPDLSMEMTLLIVKRCLTTKWILRQQHITPSQKSTVNALRLILDDEANTELSALRQVDIHLVAHAMKWAIRYSEETLVTYEDYQALYLDQDRSFSAFVHDLPPTNRAILLDLFSLCADITLLAHLNNMTLVVVAKAISLSIMAKPERDFSTFDASLQERNMCGAACEDLLRAFLRIKTTHDLAKIEQEDEVDENRYVDNITRQVKSARQRSNENGSMPNIPNYSRPDVSVPSSAGSNFPGPQGWSSVVIPTGSHGRGANGYFDQQHHNSSTPRSASPLSQHSSNYNGASLSRSHSLAKSNSSRSRPISPTPYYEEERLEYEELMQDQSNLNRLRHNRQSQNLMPGGIDRRRSSVADMESLYMLPVDASTDGYESEPEPVHESIIPDFADGLGWDFSKMDDLNSEGTHSKLSQGVNRSNSSSSNGSASAHSNSSPRAVRFLSKQDQQHSLTGVHELQDQQGTSLQRAHSQHELSRQDHRERSRDIPSPSSSSIHRSATTAMSSINAKFGQAIAQGHTLPSMTAQRAKRNSLLRRSVSLDPHTMHGRVHKRPNELRHDILTRELAIQAERSQVAEDIRSQLLQVKQDQSNSQGNSFSLESSPQDLERPVIPSRSASQGLGRSTSKSPGSETTRLEINVGSLPPRPSPAATSDGVAELTPVSNPSSSGSSIASPKAHASSSSRHDERLAIGSHARSKENEVSVLFTPITPVSPKAEQRSKFLESFPERPISPPSSYTHKRSPTATSSRSGHSSKLSPSSSVVSSPRQQALSRSNSKSQSVPPVPPTLQQSVSNSGTSSSSSQAQPTESKSKAAGFIRALSHKLRSKQSDEQLKPVKINNQVVNPSAAVAPSVSIQPPRLELSFLGEVSGGSTAGAPATAAATRALQAADSNLPPASAPATLLHLDGSLSSGPGTLESWRKQAQDSLPVPSPQQQQQQGSPKGYTGARRGSGTLFGSGQVAHRDQRRRSKIAFASPRSTVVSQGMSPKSDGNRHGNGTGLQHRLAHEKTLSDSSFTTDDSETIGENTRNKSPSNAATNQHSPKKAGEREYRFSTATLLKDGKLYYQLQWDEFSSSGFKSDFFDEPEQYLTGLHQKRMSKIPAMGGPGMNKGAARGMSGKNNIAGAASSSWDHPTGSIGSMNGKATTSSAAGQYHDPGPSPAQRAAAMKAARESFMALAKDPKALAALKAGSIGGIGQATIIGTGSFPIGSAQPLLQSRPLNLNRDVVPIANPSKSSLTYPSAKSPLRTLQAVREDDDRPRENTSERPSPKSSSVGTESRAFKPETEKHGKPSMPAGGAGSLSSSLEVGVASTKGVNSELHRFPTALTPPAKPVKKNRLFFKASKKNHRMSVTMGSDPVVLTNFNGSSSNSNSNNNSSILSKKKRPLLGVMRKDTMTKTEESLDEIFPWTCVEHTAGQDSDWVMLEPVQDGAVGWVKIDKLEEEMARFEQQQQQHRAKQPLKQYQQQQPQQQQQQQQQYHYHQMEREH
ncbi:hypothetical protein BGZ83_008343 [Gryganskiella cystojenkinii]|nr:hypothetical protein BGZ83_008343 [Gryganskiella cystojenkinii]